MGGLEFKYSGSLVSSTAISDVARHLAPEIRKMREVLKTKYENDRASINLVDDKNYAKKQARVSGKVEHQAWSQERSK